MPTMDRAVSTAKYHGLRCLSIEHSGRVKDEDCVDS